MNDNPVNICVNVYENYGPIIVFLALGFLLAFMLFVVALYRGKRNPYPQKITPYECGFDNFEDSANNARGRLAVHFYLVGILFIIFDLEIIFLFPWALSLKKIGLFGFWSMMMMLSLLSIGFLYEYRKGALDWE